MELTLRLNARFQPRHRFDLEDALQELLERENMGEVTGGVRHKWKMEKLSKWNQR